jgi:hypothetical protein
MVINHYICRPKIYLAQSLPDYRVTEVLSIAGWTGSEEERLPGDIIAPLTVSWLFPVAFSISSAVDFGLLFTLLCGGCGAFIDSFELWPHLKMPKRNQAIEVLYAKSRAKARVALVKGTVEDQWVCSLLVAGIVRGLTHDRNNGCYWAAREAVNFFSIHTKYCGDERERELYMGRLLAKSWNSTENVQILLW